jgi:dTDP-4-dehydrorhamnose reductase
MKSGGSHLRRDDPGMTWLITGGTGQLGLAMQIELGIRGISFIAVSSTQLDISKPESVDQFVYGVKPSVIVNVAAWTDVDGAELHQVTAHSVNAFGAKNLAVAARNVAAIFVHVSTDYVFSGESSSPWDENAVRDPQSVYGSSKRDGEIFVLDAYPTGTYLVRTAWLYSEFGRNFARTMTKLALKSRDEVRVVNDQTGQPTSARDLAKQIIGLILADAPFGIYHATNSGQATWFEFAQEIFNHVGADLSRLIPVMTNEFPRPAKRPAYSVLSHSAWANTSIPTMRGWQLALTEAMPAIISAVKAEE